MTRGHQQQHGFTLMELIMVIVIAGILGTMTVSFITKPMEGYIDLNRRAQLVDSAEMSMRMMARDIRRSLPNSIRCQPAGCDESGTIEMINTVTGGRYRAAFSDDPSNPGNPMQFGDDTSFDVLGNVINAAEVNISTHQLVIYNLTSDGDDYNAYSTTGMHNRAGISDFSSNQITLDSPLGISQGSPQQRFFIVDSTISYHCENNTLYRTQPSGIAGTITTNTNTPVARNVIDCKFSYEPGSATRSALVTIGLTVEGDGERVTLLHQVHVDNVP